MRRRKLAEKGQLPPDSNSVNGVGGVGGGEAVNGMREGKREGFQVVGKKRKGGR